MIVFLPASFNSRSRIRHNQGIYRMPVAWHIWLASITIFIGIFHAVLGMLAYF